MKFKFVFHTLLPEVWGVWFLSFGLGLILALTKQKEEKQLIHDGG